MKEGLAYGIKGLKCRQQQQTKMISTLTGIQGAADLSKNHFLY